MKRFDENNSVLGKVIIQPVESKRCDDINFTANESAIVEIKLETDSEKLFSISEINSANHFWLVWSLVISIRTLKLNTTTELAIFFRTFIIFFCSVSLVVLLTSFVIISV